MELKIDKLIFELKKRAKELKIIARGSATPRAQELFAVSLLLENKEVSCLNCNWSG